MFKEKTGVQFFTFTFLDLSFVFALSTISLSLMFELFSASGSLVNFGLSKRKLKNITIISAILFLITVVLQGINIIISS